ncbi:aminotransferase class V-fold PLP-dependent enzyme [Peristeroidobacter soli]|uniref:aminotransferase class V-fold PLP-dependent enzyme n=1 Tax=Peristeroidobacter soli TaxID=2497877 RepID=UPI00101C6B0A|nr:aminotransferase class V-fold PLP-dependent enzyme [Peristeroidobacter soli]
MEKGTTFDVARLRAAEFPWSEVGDKIYLNNAGTGPLPRRTVASLTDWAERRTKPWEIPDREVLFPALQRVREQCAELVGARSSEIALVNNTSFGLNLAARALPLHRGDVVLVSDREFPSIIYAWRAIEQERGIRLRIVPTRAGLLDEDAMLLALQETDVRVVTVSWVSFATGQRIDLRRLGKACRERGIFLVVDAMQGLGVVPLDVTTCGADIVACGGYKWLLSPWGAGFVYVREALTPQLTPPIVGWFVGPASEDYGRLLDYDLRYYADARRFEVMALQVQEFVAMGRSLDLLSELGTHAVANHIDTLTGRIVDWAQTRSDMRLVTPSDSNKRAGIVCVSPVDVREASLRLSRAGVIHSLREGAIRFAPHCYNTIEEIDAAIAALADT